VEGGERAVVDKELQVRKTDCRFAGPMAGSISVSAIRFWEDLLFTEIAHTSNL
jgi:hypothetical protein